MLSHDCHMIHCYRYEGHHTGWHLRWSVVRGTAASLTSGVWAAQSMKWLSPNLRGRTWPYTACQSRGIGCHLNLCRADYPPEAAIFQIGTGRPIPQLPKYLSEEVTAFILRYCPTQYFNYITADILLDRCVVKDQLKRPAANELLEDQFITKFRKKRGKSKT